MILITGGTGFVGEEVVGELLSLGQRVRLLVRNPARARRFAHNPLVELCVGDVLRPETLPSAMRGVHAVIHLIGIIAETRAVSFEQAHAEATRNVLAAAQQAGVTRWIQMTAAGTRPNARSRYHITKWRSEELVRGSGLDWTIFRPSLIYGYDERDRLLNLLGWVVSRRWILAIPLLNGGRPLVQPVSVREVARCFAHAVSKEASIGRTYELVGPVAMSWRNMVGKIAAPLGRRPFFLNLPSAPLEFLAVALNKFAPRSLQFSEQVKMAAEDNTGDPRPAAGMFGYEPEPFEQGVARLLAGENMVAVDRRAKVRFFQVTRA